MWSAVAPFGYCMRLGIFDYISVLVYFKRHNVYLSDTGVEESPTKKLNFEICTCVEVFNVCEI